MRFCDLCDKQISPEAMLVDYCVECGEKAERVLDEMWKEGSIFWQRK